MHATACQELDTRLTIRPDDSTCCSLFNFLGNALAALWKEWPRPMTVTTLKSEGAAINFTMSGQCPHCLNKVVFMMVSQPHSEYIPTSELPAGNLPQRICAALQCVSCKKFILGIVTRKEGAPGQPSYHPYVYEAHYPVGPINDSVAPEVPTDIGADFREALRCRSVNAYNATAEMCRRAIQASCDELKANGKNLCEQIDDLASRGIITQPLQEIAHMVRLGGNRAAHPSPTKIEEKDADAIIAFMKHYFEHVYVLREFRKQFDFSKP